MAEHGDPTDAQATIVPSGNPPVDHGAQARYLPRPTKAGTFRRAADPGEKGRIPLLACRIPRGAGLPERYIW